MIKRYICCLVLIIGNVEVGLDMDMKFHQEVMEIVGVDPGFDQGGPDHDRPKLPTVCSSIMRVKQALSLWGLGPTLGVQKLLGFSLLNMHSLHFGIPFYTILEMIKY